MTSHLETIVPLFRRHFHRLVRQLGHDNGDHVIIKLFKSNQIAWALPVTTFVTG
jgi:hypothetical protein